MRKGYPSDIKREQFEQIRELLESARRKTAPRRVERYEVFCAVLYLLRTGCQWRALPSDFPKWRTVHSYWAIWSEPREGGSLLERALKNQVGAARQRLGRSACGTLLIVDAQSVKNTDTAGAKGYDAGKKVSGIKRHVAVDSQGLRDFEVMPKRWMVERSFAWLEKNRRLWKNCERWLNTSCSSSTSPSWLY